MAHEVWCRQLGPLPLVTLLRCAAGDVRSAELALGRGRGAHAVGTRRRAKAPPLPAPIATPPASVPARAAAAYGAQVRTSACAWLRLGARRAGIQYHSDGWEAPCGSLLASARLPPPHSARTQCVCAQCVLHPLRSPPATDVAHGRPPAPPASRAGWELLFVPNMCLARARPQANDMSLWMGLLAASRARASSFCRQPSQPNHRPTHVFGVAS